MIRPNSRGNTSSGRIIGTSGGIIPGTGVMRPGSGRLTTASRLRTGLTPSGPGTQAAQGFALNVSVNVQDRPVTGQGIAGLKTHRNSGRLVEDTSYYIGILRKRINDITSEIQRLQILVEKHAKENAIAQNIEKKYETLLKSKESLEGQLADYNLALDKTRTSTDPEDIRDHVYTLADKNHQTGQELDHIFSLRKERENEINKIQDRMEEIQNDIQSRINSLETSKLRIYKDLSSRQKEFEVSIKNDEIKLQEINEKIDSYEHDNKTNPYRKEYMSLDRLFKSYSRDVEALQVELDIICLEPKEAHAKFVSRVNELKQTTKIIEDKIVQEKDEIEQLKKKLSKLDKKPKEVITYIPSVI
jgi:intraflagellar transport protein 74